VKDILVLCIDRDDDLGQKAKVNGPVIGEEKNISAAEKLALADPEDSDVNTIYKAVKVMRDLEKESKGVEVVTLTGDTKRGSKADLRVSQQLEAVLAKFEPKGVVFVSDGADDEQLLPVIQSRVGIISVERVVVKQAPQLEKGYYVITNALKDPYFARIFFGLPGLILILYLFFGLNTVVALIGIYLIIKGFGMEEGLLEGIKGYVGTISSTERASFPLYLSSLFFVMIGAWAGYDNTIRITNQFGSILPYQVAGFINGSIQSFLTSAILFSVARIFDAFFQKKPYKIKKYLSYILSANVIWWIGDSAALFAMGQMSLQGVITAIVGGFLVSLIGLAVIRAAYEKFFVVERILPGLEVMKGSRMVGAIDKVFKSEKYFVIKGKEKERVDFSDVLFVKNGVFLK
jgi:putative membrane protein